MTTPRARPGTDRDGTDAPSLHAGRASGRAASPDGPGFVDVPFDGLEPERLVPTLPGLGLAMQSTEPPAGRARAADGA